MRVESLRHRPPCIFRYRVGRAAFRLAGCRPNRPLELRQWIVVDQKSQEVRVGLFEAQFGVELEQELFRVPKKKN